MHASAQQLKTSQQAAHIKPPIHGQSQFGHGWEVTPVCYPPSTIANQTVQWPLGVNTTNVKENSTTETACLGHDFSRIPVFSIIPFQIQAKLAVSTPGDQYEQEADKVADSVMAGFTSPVAHISYGVQPKLYRVELRPEDMVDSMFPTGEQSEAGFAETILPAEVRRSATGDAGTVAPRFEQSLQQAIHVGGEPLPSSGRSFMESRLGHDFSSVRVHTDDRAHALAQEINARAFTLGKDIFFARSQYQPESQEGQYLLAHELTHVIQQTKGRLSRQIQRQTSCSNYNGYDSSVSLRNYNCAGLATRTYQYISPPSAVYDSIMANFILPQTPAGGSCGAGAVKFWLWEYDIHLEDDRGTVLSPNNRDFHIVAGRTDPTGADPTDVYSKNGARRVYGPGNGPGFRPATRDRALSNDPSETPVTSGGRPVFKVRSNMSEAITCARCHP
ncbi:MAG: DUF4157 domain-containing protein [Nitrospira sp.]|nr:DUF4157 domain-containing protein [Nitrospira sp.]